MVLKESKGTENVFEKTPMKIIIDEVLVRRSEDREKYGTESLELKGTLINDETGEITSTERTVFLNLGTIGCEETPDGIFTYPSWSEANGLFMKAAGAGVSIVSDVEPTEANPDGTLPTNEKGKPYKFEVYDVIFDPSIVGAYIELGVRKSEVGEGDNKKTFTNYVVEDFNLSGIPDNGKKQKPVNVAGRAAGTAPTPQATGRQKGRATAQPASKTSNENMQLGYEGRAQFRKYLAFHAAELNEHLTVKRLRANLAEYAFSSQDVRDWVTKNIEKLIDEEMADTQSVLAQIEGSDEMVYVGTPYAQLE